MNELIPFSEMGQMADTMFRSGMFGKTKEQLLSLMLIAHAEGIHPAIAAMEYDVIKGRPAINSRSALARFQSAGGSVKWLERTDKKVSAKFTHPQGGEVVIDWTIERAKAAGYTEKENRDGSPNMWQKVPAQMLAARTIAEGVRAVYPACLSRMYTVEEVQDIEQPEMRPAVPNEPDATPARADVVIEIPESVDELCKALLEYDEQGFIPESAHDTIEAELGTEKKDIQVLAVLLQRVKNANALWLEKNGQRTWMEVKKLIEEKENKENENSLL
ncbi:MAG: hypothetical protein KKB59_14280 [Spirochaetes bacterium]|nr:hypothetical protein [Spirochaetota bacterium]